MNISREIPQEMAQVLNKLPDVARQNAQHEFYTAEEMSLAYREAGEAIGTLLAQFPQFSTELHDIWKCIAHIFAVNIFEAHKKTFGQTDAITFTNSSTEIIPMIDALKNMPIFSTLPFIVSSKVLDHDEGVPTLFISIRYNKKKPVPSVPPADPATTGTNSPEATSPSAVSGQDRSLTAFFPKQILEDLPTRIGKKK